MAVATAGPAQEAASHQAAPGAAIRIEKVAIVTDAALDERARYGMRRLEAALRSKGIAVSEGGQVSGTDFVLLAGMGSGNGAAAAALAQLKAAVPAESEALAIRTGARYQSKPAIILAGGDGAGLMYAALDLADRIGWAQNGATRSNSLVTRPKSHTSKNAAW